MQRELLKLVQRLLRGELRKFKRRRTGGLARIAIVVGLALAVFGIDYLLREPELPAPRPGTDLVCSVREIADGDTVTLSCPGGRLRVRVWGIDAPESGQQPWGDRSRDHLRQLLQPASELQVQIVDTDRYGRSVARLFSGQRDIGLAMVEAGQAIVYERYNDSPGYRTVQAAAREAGRGVWSEPGDQQDPAAWRRVNNPR